VASAAELVGFLKRPYQKYEDNEVGDGAAAISYYLIFSLFPFHGRGDERDSRASGVRR
jgi:uncharacterized BrkB/YihY/UPF0761 family membrane protein